MPNVHFDFRRGAGSAPEILFGTVSIKATSYFQRGTSLVLPAPTTLDLVDGEATANNVAPSPAPVDGQVEWAYVVTAKDRHGKSFEWIVGVPFDTGTVEFASLPRYFETKPPLFGQGPKGDPGEAATIEVGSVTSGETPSITNSGTANDAVLDFVLPKGDKGDRGDGVPDGGTALQYIRKDATGTGTEWATLNKDSVGLSNVDNTSDGSKPVSAPQKTYIDQSNTLAYQSKTVTDAPDTYPEGVTVGLFSVAMGWPELVGSHPGFVLVKTDRPRGNPSATQWVYPYVTGTSGDLDNTHIMYRVGSSTGAWGEWQTQVNKDFIDSHYIPRHVVQTLYVDRSTGSDGNSGQTPAQPLRTLGKAVAIAESAAMGNDAVFEVFIGPGTYPERVRFASSTPFPLNITLNGADVGGHPNTPTTVFSEAASGVSAAAIICNNPIAVVTVNNIKFVGYNGTTSSQGINMSQGMLFTNNVHADTCFWGISMIRGNLDVKGGILENCGSTSADTGNGGGIRSLMLTRHAIGRQNAGDNTQGPFFRNNRNGVFIQEGSTGHVDWATFEDNNYGVTCNVNSRANCDGSKFYRNTVGMRASGGSNIFTSSNTGFGNGVNANTIPLYQTNFGYISWDIVGVNGAYAPVETTVYGQYDPVTVTGTTNPTSAMSRTVEAPYFAGRIPFSNVGQRKLKVRTVGRITGGGGTKNIHMSFGGSTVSTLYTASNVGTFVWEGEVAFIKENTQTLLCVGNLHLSNPRMAYTTATVNMEMDQTLQLRVTLENPMDTVEFFSVEVIST